MSNETKRPVILCVGSDKRQVFAARGLTRLGRVYCCGTDDSADGSIMLGRLSDMPEKAELLLLPVPCNTKLRIPSSAGAIDCRELADHLEDGALVAGGMMNGEMLSFFSERGFAAEDYFKREELVLRNCIPTAEGALEIALRELDVTVSGLSTLIVGWGRVAKACAKLFAAVGAKTAVAARSSSALAEAAAAGHKVFPLGKLSENAAGFPLIINTVPAKVITAEVIGCVSSDCLIIDLASKPGGTDFDTCERLGIRYVHALGLPGKCSPKTAGGIIADTVIQIFRERSDSNVT